MEMGASWSKVALTAILVGAGTACSSEAADHLASTAEALSASSAADRAALALRWGPIHYQDVDQTGSHALGGEADYITRYDYDGDLNGRNNWDHAGNTAYPLSAHAYYSVVETSTHWFIVYMYYHPRDWTDYFFDTEHENDSEGLLVSVRRDGSPYGTLQSAVTVAHTDFFSYVPNGGTWKSGAESVDGVLKMTAYGDGPHPETAQQAKGHGLKARPQYDIVGDGIVYYPSLTAAEIPSSPDDRGVTYRLIDIFEPGGLWDQRNNPSLFASFGSFAGDSTGGCGRDAIGCSANAANAPWGWDDHDDRPGRGTMATDPAGLVSNYFTIPEVVSTVYTFNPYR